MSDGEPQRDERNVIFLADDSADSASVRRFLDQRQVSYAEVGDTIDWSGRTPYKRPTLLIYGDVYQGSKEIKRAIAMNRQLYR